MESVIVWFRQDLRLADHPALSAAVATGMPVIPLFIWDADGEWAPGAAQRYWLHQSLCALQGSLAAAGSRLIVRRGDSAAVLHELARSTGARAVYWNRRYEPAGIACDTRIKATLDAVCEVRSFNGRLLFEPFTVATAGGTPYRVFTPFWRTCLKLPEPPEPLPAPARITAPAGWPPSLALDALGLQPRIDWAAGIRQRWHFGEQAALARLDDFIDGGLRDYPARRDFPGVDGVSGLSPYLHCGEISPRQVWHAVRAGAATLHDSATESAAQAWLRQLVWREFAYHLLYHFPTTATTPLRDEFARMEWLDDVAGVAAWQRGRTGFPLVDAGMRELWATGFMHNRVRMVVASLLCKHLGQHWLTGARWFWDTLVDADLANNTLGWQWIAGCGADAAPYYRIFNPSSQSRRFDPRGDYIRRWVPELAHLEGNAIHEPQALAPGYPAPIVDLAAAREAALARYARMRA